MGIVRTFPVIDANGDRFTVFELRERRSLRFVRRLKLCTGEPVAMLGDRLVIESSGEELERVTDDN